MRADVFILIPDSHFSHTPMGYKHLIGRVPAYKISKKSIFVGRFCFQVFFQELENLTRRTFRAIIPP